MKPNLFIDFDSTLVDSIETFCEVYNVLYSFHPDFIPADYAKIQRWDFKDICPLIDDVNEIFSSPIFFALLDFFEDAKEVIKQLNEKYNIIICSIGTPENIALKAIWLKKNLPFVHNYILIHNKGNIMNKSIINMEGGIIIDDVASNLESSNASRKICFGQVYPWNERWQGERVKNWKEIGSLLL